MKYLFIHAHPDDETLATGVALAQLATTDQVYVLTCTLGEMGEVIPPELAHLAADADDTLGAYRRGELRRAMEALGVEHEVLGENALTGALSRWRDSGMAGAPSAADPRAWVNADRAEAVTAVREVIERIDPDVVVTYDEHGGYGHPDHIATHRVTCAAVDAMGAGRPQVWAVYLPAGWAREDRVWLADHLSPGALAELGWTLPDPDGEYPPSVVEDLDLILLQVPEAVGAQVSALVAHRTQVSVAETPHGPVYALSNNIAARLPGREAYCPIDPASGRPLPRSAWSVTPSWDAPGQP
ncbi:N-acetyl-1-D-myo-inositol-2-amino-2-deoxy-alpha-D-glucopyranoside deacetylase [Kribbia dieselivorans]|uniref:N-acetyl-1-D-myo-inositol-2-amino-2-deoxy-alpha- D-glucopyranoside deacetylase n=1 Tax=Kribbia dieselivorans TaxID=331526 RepID=UPI0008382FF5|nr:N-acetyl-1-D-myo-inositol-2-amino-2-deoxy-alpha-D-glucopyranoside deacetylase [Kribbia dieselivorans]